MASFIAELFVSTHYLHLYTIGKFPRFVWHDLLQKYNVKKFHWCPSHLQPTVIIRICLVLINSCGCSASKVLVAFEGKKHILSAYIVGNTLNVISVVWSYSWSVVIICYNSTYFEFFFQKSQILFITDLCQTTIHRVLSSIGLKLDLA